MAKSEIVDVEAAEVVDGVNPVSVFGAEDAEKAISDIRSAAETNYLV